MIHELVENREYKNMVRLQIKEVMTFLMNANQEFAITANVKGITFDPQLPSSILDQLSNFSLFVLSNYTYSTIKIDNEFLYFEAGFGKENFGAQVKIPLTGIFQIIIDESIIYINPIATFDKFFEKEKLEKNSMDVFKNNPHNKKLVDKGNKK